MAAAKHGEQGQENHTCWFWYIHREDSVIYEVATRTASRRFKYKLTIIVEGSRQSISTCRDQRCIVKEIERPECFTVSDLQDR